MVVGPGFVARQWSSRIKWPRVRLDASVPGSVLQKKEGDWVLTLAPTSSVVWADYTV